MFGVDLAFPFTLGLVAAFNPCGFAMLPVYVSFFLGKTSGSMLVLSGAYLALYGWWEIQVLRVEVAPGERIRLRIVNSTA